MVLIRALNAAFICNIVVMIVAVTMGLLITSQKEGFFNQVMV